MKPLHFEFAGFNNHPDILPVALNDLTIGGNEFPLRVRHEPVVTLVAAQGIAPIDDKREQFLKRGT